MLTEEFNLGRLFTFLMLSFYLSFSDKNQQKVSIFSRKMSKFSEKKTRLEWYKQFFLFILIVDNYSFRSTVANKKKKS